ncbi:MAG: FkbM family methyltransferase [Actinomycetota bacterium]
MASTPFSAYNFLTTLCVDPGDRPSLMLDVGAQQGQFARVFARNGYDVIAFEASPVNFDDLTERVRTTPNITPVHLAVSDEDASGVKFYFSTEYIGINSLKRNSTHLSETSYALVDTVRLATHLGDDAARVEVIKTDIEGADLLALRGFDFESHHPAFVLSEYGGRSAAFGYDIDDMVEHMRRFGYEAWATSYDSGTGKPYAKSTGDQAPVELRFFGDVDAIDEPNWGDVLFFRPESRSRLVRHAELFDFGSAALAVGR